MSGPHESMDDMAEFAHRCCNGNCEQGRKCPRRKQTMPESLGVRLLAFYDVVAWIAALAFLTVVLHG